MCSGSLSPSSIAAERKKYGIAVVGLGNFATSSIIPALKQTSECKLTVLVSSDHDKAVHLSQSLGLKPHRPTHISSFDRIADDDRIDIVLVATPNAMHGEFALRAAQAGKHVVIAAPIAGSASEAYRMADACSNFREAYRSSITA